MRRLIAVVLIVLGAAGILLGRLGETLWAPPTERRAAVALEDPGPAVLIDPGVAYVGGHTGTVQVSAPGDVRIIPVSPEVAEAYLGDARHTRITGVPTWTTLETREVAPAGETTLPDPAGSEAWPPAAGTPSSEASIEISALWREDGGATPAHPYRALLIVGNGTSPAASRIVITWPVDSATPWVPYAYAAGALIAVLGLVLFAADHTARALRRRSEEEA